MTSGAAGWRLKFSSESDGLPTDLLPRLEQTTLELADRDSGFYRRSRHAVTFVLIVRDENRPNGFVGFLKIYDPPKGMKRIKHALRGPRVAHLERVGRALRTHGFGVPRLVLIGEHRETGRELMLTENVVGVSLASLLDRRSTTDALRKREVLRALGAEIARLHAAGFIHGDLTPHNVFVGTDEPPRFKFIDHDRTRRGLVINRRRAQLRNLVQLFRFDLAAMSRADRLRIFHAWARGLAIRRERRVLRRLFAMVHARLARDRATAQRQGRRM